VSTYLRRGQCLLAIRNGFSDGDNWKAALFSLFQQRGQELYFGLSDEGFNCLSVKKFPP